MLSTLLVVTLLLCSAVLCYMTGQSSASMTSPLHTQPHPFEDGTTGSHPDDVGYAAVLFVVFIGTLFGILGFRGLKKIKSTFYSIRDGLLTKTPYLSPASRRSLTQVFRL